MKFGASDQPRDPAATFTFMHLFARHLRQCGLHARTASTPKNFRNSVWHVHTHGTRAGQPGLKRYIVIAAPERQRQLIRWVIMSVCVCVCAERTQPVYTNVAG